MVINEKIIDAAVAEVLRAGSFPEGLTPEVEDLWMAVTALEAVVHGRLTSTGLGTRALPTTDLRALRRLAARVSVLSAVATAGGSERGPADRNNPGQSEPIL